MAERLATAQEAREETRRLDAQRRQNGYWSTDTDDAVADVLAASRLDWSRVRDSVTDVQFALEPLFGAGRSHSLTAAMGGGKSLLTLWAVSMGCLGRRVLGRPEGEPLRALYIDAENTLPDILERLEAFGVDPDELAKAGTLAYCHLPVVAHGFDTWKDAEVLIRHARDHRADLVVIDTAAATMGGPENDADTWASLARLVTGPLKAEGRALVRLDHPGKDPTRGRRGSSAKLADCDVAWRMTAGDHGGLLLVNTKKRMPWIADRVHLHRIEDNGTIGWREVEREWPAGTAPTAQVLERLAVSPTASCNDATKALRDAGEGRRREVVLAAQRYRRESGTTPGTTPQLDAPEPPREPRGTTLAVQAGTVPPL